MKKMMISLGFAALALGATAQVKIKDGTITGSSTTPNSNAILELESNQRGLLYPRVALSSTSSASPLTVHIKGMVVYDTATVAANGITPGIYYNDGTQWVRVINSSSSTNTAFIYGTGTPQTAGATCNSAAQNTIYVDTGSASATLGQTWICDGTNWQNYNAPASTEWNIAGTSTDAGASKTANIGRTGSVVIGSTGTPNSTFQVNGSFTLPMTVYSGPGTIMADSTMFTILFYLNPSLPTLQLPDPTTCRGRMYKIVNESGYAINITVTNYPNFPVYGINTGNGLSGSSAATVVLTQIPAPTSGLFGNNTILLQSSGAAWHKVGL